MAEREDVSKLIGEAVRSFASFHERSHDFFYRADFDILPFSAPEYRQNARVLLAAAHNEGGLTQGKVVAALLQIAQIKVYPGPSAVSPRTEAFTRTLQDRVIEIIQHPDYKPPRRYP